jgi:MFS family permease
MGSWMLLVGLPFFVHELTGSTLAPGTTLMASMLPRIFLGSFAGVFVDRWDRRRTMAVSNVALALGLSIVLR